MPTHVRDTDGIPSFWIQLGSAPTVVGIWEITMNQHMEVIFFSFSLSLCLSFSSSLFVLISFCHLDFQINEYIFFRKPSICLVNYSIGFWFKLHKAEYIWYLSVELNQVDVNRSKSMCLLVTWMLLFLSGLFCSVLTYGYFWFV